MQIGIHSIEDCLEVITGLQKHNLEFKVDGSDSTIMNSIARQVFKGTALTDRQYNLMREKLQKYKEQFESQDVIGFDRALDKLREPLRKIDRSCYIKIVDTTDVYADSVQIMQKENLKWIEVRFPFKKSHISLINEITATQEYHHKKGTHSHFFVFNAINTLNVLDRFKNKNFEIEQEIIEVYNKAVVIRDNKHQYLSGIKNNKLINIHENLNKIINEEVGEFNAQSYIKFIDRKLRYGFNLSEDKVPTTIAEKIAYRKEDRILCRPSEYQLDSVLKGLKDLDRFPILFLLEKNRADIQLYELISFYKNFIPAEQQSVLFRSEDKDSDFNTLIKQYQLNNWVDNNTKIVYISTDKLPKVLLNADWSPCVTFTYNSRFDTNIETYVSSRTDLIVYREEDISPFKRFMPYGNM